MVDKLQYIRRRHHTVVRLAATALETPPYEPWPAVTTELSCF